MISLPDTLQSLIDSFKKLPGIGAKTAERLAYYIAENTNESNYNFSKNIINVKDKLSICTICFFYIEKENICNACNSKRDESKICVVQRPKDVIAIDKTGFPGLYHVLGGVLSPLDQIGPEDLNINELFKRLNDDIREVIIATDTSLEGDATSIYLADKLERYNSKIIVSKLARGIPLGGQFDYIDEMTLAKAFTERTKI
tara:strand:- start:30606 stop:31205 length:600 start_codon:yes stop_codon:yes gene_type:complete